MPEAQPVEHRRFDPEQVSPLPAAVPESIQDLLRQILDELRSLRNELRRRASEVRAVGGDGPDVGIEESILICPLGSSQPLTFRSEA